MRSLAAALLLLAACGSPPVPLTPEEEFVLRPIRDMAPNVRALVERGDAHFVDALTPHRKGETQTALDRYANARSAYLEAETHYYSGQIPPPLLARVNECVTRIAALQRQRHAAPK
jgi:hypothetical protein